MSWNTKSPPPTNSLKTLGHTNLFGGGGQTTFKKIGSDPNMEDSPHLYFMLLIDMKFISKLLYILLMEKVTFSILISTQLFLKYILKIIYIYIYSQFYINIFFEKKKTWWIYLSKKENFRISRFSDMEQYIFKDDSIFVLVLFGPFW